MSKKIAEFYISEITEWIKSIGHYIDESNVIEQRLEDIIKRNTIVDIAAKVEVHQMMLDNVTDKMIQFKDELLLQKNDLMINEQPLEDAGITEEIELKMKLTALKFTQSEKEFIDIKYYCNSFLLEMLKR